MAGRRKEEAEADWEWRRTSREAAGWGEHGVGRDGL